MMFMKQGSGRHPRSLKNNNGTRGTRCNASHQSSSNFSSSSSASGSTAGSARWIQSVMVPGAAAAIGSGLVAATYLRQKKQEKDKVAVQVSQRLEDVEVPEAGSIVKSGWAHDIASEPGTVRIFTAEELLAEENPYLEDDHMFSAFIQKGIIADMEGYYQPSRKQFSAVVALGYEVAGFPRVVHGGLTAAIFDEIFGGLLFSLKRYGGLPFWGPAYTVQVSQSLVL